MVHIGAGQVGQQHTKGDGQQQHGFVFLHDGQVHQQAGNGDHYQAQRIFSQLRKTRGLDKVLNWFYIILHEELLRSVGMATSSHIVLPA